VTGVGSVAPPASSDMAVSTQLLIVVANDPSSTSSGECTTSQSVKGSEAAKCQCWKPDDIGYCLGLGGVGLGWELCR
jgi:hypothetical protein